MRSDVPVFPDYAPTLPNVIARCASQFADREFLVHGDRRLTYSGAERESSHLARGLLAAGVGKATRVAIIMPDSVDWVVAWWAAARIGAFTIPLSTFFQSREISWALNEADVDTLLVSSCFFGNDYLARLERAIPELAGQSSTELFLPSHPFLRRIVVWGPCDRAWAIKGPQALSALAGGGAGPRIDDAFLSRIEAQVTPADWLIGICTSGSTSQPKIVIHSHGGFIRTTHAYRLYALGVDRNERNYCGMPLFWLGGLNTNLMPVTYEGACMIFGSTPRREEVLDIVLKENVTRISMWSAQFKSLCELAESRNIDIQPLLMPNLHPLDSDGKPIPQARRIVNLLGMTECCGPHSVGRFEEILPEKNGASWGHGLDGIDRKVVDPATGESLPTRQDGELYVRGFSLMQGYYKREREDVFKADGFFPTGDTCNIDADGHLYFKGRSSELIKTSGANVSPQEVEGLMQSYRGIAEAVVIGLPDDQRGECVVAVIVAAEGVLIDAIAIQQQMKLEISSYKVPKHLIVMAYDEIPRTAAGKVQRNVLKEQIRRRLNLVS